MTSKGCVKKVPFKALLSVLDALTCIGEKTVRRLGTMSSCADVFIELLSTKNKLLSADTWMMSGSRMTNDDMTQSCFWSYSTSIEVAFGQSNRTDVNLSVLVSKNADQPWDVELTDDSNRAEQRRKKGA
ncbi:hypothetical protein DPMN_052518 [Dreissena polymorpha]|uniref:Uncharacterized protein n=1 Tax=Dreissena polymorpha TaxID=45954 RepID=A0A9D4CJU6_DREPO|nr:hypothetical protein DPMN_052518 [Dreissena polymorpha]